MRKSWNNSHSFWWSFFETYYGSFCFHFVLIIFLLACLPKSIWWRGISSLLSKSSSSCYDCDSYFFALQCYACWSAYFYRWNLSSHLGHWYNLNSKCLLSWSLRLHRVINVFSQKWHMNSRSPVWIFRCVLRLVLWINSLSQFWCGHVRIFYLTILY